jgi:hypothetical protein
MNETEGARNEKEWETQGPRIGGEGYEITVTPIVNSL